MSSQNVAFEPLAELDQWGLEPTEVANRREF